MAVSLRLTVTQIQISRGYASLSEMEAKPLEKLLPSPGKPEAFRTVAAAKPRLRQPSKLVATEQAIAVAVFSLFVLIDWDRRSTVRYRRRF